MRDEDVTFHVASLDDDDPQPLFAPAPPLRRLLPRPGRRMRQALLVAAVALLTVGGLLTYAHARQAAFDQQHPAGIDPARNGMNTPLLVRWSPDGRQIAVIGASVVTQRAPNARTALTVSNFVLLYSVNPTRLERRLPLTALFPTRQLASFDTFTINALLWTPDGRSLLIVFLKREVEANADGFATVDLSDGAISSTTTTDQPGSRVVEWDLAQRHALAYATTDPTGTGAATSPFPVAAAYHWGADGALLALPAADGTGPIGNPDGGASFTIWQAGQLTRRILSDATSNNLWQYYFDASFAALAPDGRYLALLTVSAALSPAVVVAGSFAPCGCVPVVAPPHDAAVVALMSQTPNASVFLAPDGRSLVAITQDVTALTARGYDTTTGRATGTLPVPAAALGEDFGPELLLAIAPNSRALVLISANTGDAQLLLTL